MIEGGKAKSRAALGGPADLGSHDPAAEPAALTFRLQEAEIDEAPDRFRVDAVGLAPPLRVVRALEEPALSRRQIQDLRRQGFGPFERSATV